MAKPVIMAKPASPHTNWHHPHVGDGWVHPGHHPNYRPANYFPFQVEMPAPMRHGEFSRWVYENNGIPTTPGATFFDEKSAMFFKLRWSDFIVNG